MNGNNTNCHFNANHEKTHTIPDDLAHNFRTVEGRRNLIELYGDKAIAYSGINEDGEDIVVSFSTTNGIVLLTNQHNGWVRVSHYDANGFAAGETFEGRWK